MAVDGYVEAVYRRVAYAISEVIDDDGAIYVRIAGEGEATNGTVSTLARRDKEAYGVFFIILNLHLTITLT